MARHLASTLLCLLALFGAARAAEPIQLRAEDFGVVGDGKSDDGPAILRLVAAARKQEGAPVRLVFPRDRVIHAATAEEGYLLSLKDMRNVSVDGNGSTFLLDPRIRMARLDFARNVALGNLRVDQTVSMFVETTIMAVDPKLGFFDVRPNDPAEADALGGATKQDGEQWFGGFIWCGNDHNPKATKHFGVKSAERLEGGLVRLFHGESEFSRKIAASIVPGVTKFSAPRVGVAHRRGPGALFEIRDATDVRLEKVTVWGATWFVFGIYRCEGTCRFLDVDVVPRPGTQRRMSACRDAFHVTANRAKLVFDGCDTRGTGDDDYNFCVLSSTVRKVNSPTEILIRQKFPVQYNPMRVGDTLMVANAENTVLGSAKITAYTEMPNAKNDPVVPGGSCPQVRITLESPVAGLAPGLTVWSEEAANPDTTMTNCTAAFSIRFQTSLKIDRCKFTSYNAAYGYSPNQENVEGPGPAFLRITNSEFLTDRGSGLAIQGAGAGPLPQTRLRDVWIEGCVFDAPLRIAKARSVTLLGNRFLGEVKLGECQSLEAKANTRNGAPYSPEKPGPSRP